MSAQKGSGDVRAHDYDPQYVSMVEKPLEAGFSAMTKDEQERIAVVQDIRHLCALMHMVEGLVLQGYKVTFSACDFGYRCDILSPPGRGAGYNGVGESLTEAFECALRTAKEHGHCERTYG